MFWYGEGSRPVGILSQQGECVCWWRESNGACCRGRNSSRESPIDRTETERTRTERRRSAQDGANSLDEMFGARRTGTGTVARLLWVLVVSWPSRSRPTSSRWSGRRSVCQMDGQWRLGHGLRTELGARGATLSPPRWSRPTPSWSSVSVARDTNWPRFPMDAIRVSGRHRTGPQAVA